MKNYLCDFKLLSIHDFNNLYKNSVNTLIKSSYIKNLLIYYSTKAKYHIKISNFINKSLVKVLKLLKKSFALKTIINKNFIYKIIKDRFNRINFYNIFNLKTKKIIKHIFIIVMNELKINRTILLDNYTDKNHELILTKILYNGYNWSLFNKPKFILNYYNSYILKNVSSTIQYDFYNLASKVIFGQDKNLFKISYRLIKLHNNKFTKPIANWLLCGPSGTGKTELAKLLSKYIYKTDNNLVHINMSELQEQHSVARLIGAPPGYVGSDKPTEFISKLTENPNLIILFDEIEKADKSIYPIFLQMLEDGVLTDSKGVKVYFNKTCIIFTSNLGSDVFKDACSHDSLLADYTSPIYAILEEHFAPEFINRLDGIIIFNPLPMGTSYILLSNLINNTLTNEKYKNNIKFLISIGSFSPMRGSRFLITSADKILSEDYEIKSNKHIINNYNKLIKCLELKK